MADYRCRHCGADLDKGDVYEVMLVQYGGDAKRALQAAKAYGWSESKRIHFNRSVIVQPDGRPQWVECPDCKGKDPLPGSES